MEPDANLTVNMDISRGACLSDVDDISDIDVEDVVEKLQKTITSKPSFVEKKSIFNTTLDPDEDDECEHARAAIEAFVKGVSHEQQLWESFASRYMQMQRKSATDENKNKPSEEQQAYLHQCPNLQNYVRGFGTFMSDANAFIQQFEEVQVLQRNLSTFSQCLANQTIRNNLAETLAQRELKKY